MATFKPITGNAIKNTGGTILGGGNSSNSDNNVLSFAENSLQTKVGSIVYEAVSPTDSGNLGTFRPISGGVFSNTGKGSYTGMIIGTKVAGVSNTLLRSPAAYNKPKLNYALGNHRYDITSWDYVTGRATKGVNAGQLFTYWDPIAGATKAVENYPTDTVPGEFCYLVTGLTPTMADYQGRTLT